MYCPTCGSEERQFSQYCRACGTDLRVVRVSLEKPDSITESAISAREQIGRAVAEKIRETENAHELHRMAAVVLPEIEKFLESPTEKRLRRARAGIITAATGLGAIVFFLLISTMHNIGENVLPAVGVGVIAFIVGLGLMINGLLFTTPLKGLVDSSDDVPDQNLLEKLAPRTPPVPKQASTLANKPTNELDLGIERATMPASVTEHTTHRLKGEDPF